MEPATEDGRDWSGLPEDLVVNFLREMHVADAVRSGAVCTSWQAAYAALRRLRIQSSTRQPPCLLYASDHLGPGAAALHCPATGATLQVPFPLPPLPRRPLLGSGHGWLVTADEKSNLHLLNPVTGDQITLPPITAIHHVKMWTDETGDPAYNVYENLPGDKFNHVEGRYEVDTEPTILDVGDAHEFMYDRVVLSASPSAGRACVVLLLHMPLGEVSFARLGDDRWTWVAPRKGSFARLGDGRWTWVAPRKGSFARLGDGRWTWVVAPGKATGLPWRYGYCDAMYSAAHGLFYLLQNDPSMCSLDLSGPSPVACEVFNNVPKSGIPTTKYLVQTPAGDILQVWRYRDDVFSLLPVDIPSYDFDGEGEQDPYLEFNTVDLQICKVDFPGQRLELIKSLPHYALFLGLNDTMCLSVKDFSGLKTNSAYISDDFFEYVNCRKYNRREVGIWSMAEQGMSKLVDVSPVIYPWLTWPPPIWIQTLPFLASGGC